MREKVALITGSSSGFGLLTCVELAKAGFRVLATMRNIAKRGLLDQTLVIISAKHGQSPVDPAKLAKIGDAVTPILTAAGVNVAQNTEDDISLIWLSNQSQTAAGVAALTASVVAGNPARIQTVLSGDALADQFGDPAHNTRTPDIIVEPIPGTIYTHSAAKVAEHGGFSEDDTHVALLVIDGTRPVRNDVVAKDVETRQIAPTILRFLGLDPDALQSVRQEHTTALPH